jgi:N4-gp56 family major capsid protein
MPFTTNMTGTTQIDDSIVLAFEQQFLITVGEDSTMDQFAAWKQDLNAKSIQITKYARLPLATTPLTEVDDVTSEAVADTQILFTPAEYGQAITRTELASLQSGGKIDLSIPELVGRSMAMTKNKLATLALEASANAIVVAGATEATLAAGNIMSGVVLNSIYNKLARASVPTLADGMYAAVMHDDVIHDLRAESGWIDVAKYADAVQVLKNEVGMYKGFRITRNNLCSFADQTGAGLVDAYKSSFFGARAFGLAESKAPTMTMTGPFDKLGRFVNIGWHGVFQYKILDTDAVYTVLSASSVGANAA